MDEIYGSRDFCCLSIHGGLMTIGQRGRSGGWEVVMIARREREEVVGVVTNSATWRWSCGDDHTMMLKRGDQWFFDGKMVPAWGWEIGAEWVWWIMEVFSLCLL
jgi:hypothetical protein